MRKFLILIGIVVAVFATSCKKDTSVSNEGDKSISDDGKSQVDTANYFYFKAREAGAEISMATMYDPTGSKVHYSAYIDSLQYQVNGTSDNGWQDFIIDVTTITLQNAGDKVYFRANGYNLFYGSFSYKTNGKKVDVGGNILYLVNKTIKEIVDYEQFDSLFVRCSIVDASALVLPNTTKSCCYHYMFKDCKDLTNAPALPATTAAAGCYSGMFCGCTALKTAPDLPANVLGKECYRSMFSGCTSLETAPYLPAMNLADMCYYRMFVNCTALKSAILPADSISESEENCYACMFQGCSNLSSVTMKATKIEGNPFRNRNWLTDAGISASSSVLIVDNSITTSHEAWSKIDEGTPNFWTIKTENGTVLRNAE